MLTERLSGYSQAVMAAQQVVVAAERPEETVLAELVEMKSLTMEQLSWECDDNLFLELGSQIPHSGLTLALSLGLTRADEGQIKRDEDNERDRIIATLLKWKEKDGSDATYLALIKIFIQYRKRELAEFILDYAIKNVCLVPAKKDKSDQSHLTEKSSRLSVVKSKPVSTKAPKTKSVQDTRRSKSAPVSNFRTLTVEEPQYQNNPYSWVFNKFYDRIIDIVSKDQSLGDSFIQSMRSNSLVPTMLKTKADQLSCLPIKNRAIIGTIGIHIHKCRFPIWTFTKFLRLIGQFPELEELAKDMKQEAEKFGFIMKLKVSQSKPKDVAPKKLSMSATDLQEASLTESIKAYADHLKLFYATRSYMKRSSGPKISPSGVFIDLALAKNDSHQFSLAIIHGSVDHILKRKAQLTLEDLHLIQYGSSVLIEGGPGIGKSTLAFELCRRWVNKIAFQQYSILLLLQLRNKPIQSALSSIDQLLGCFLHSQSWKQQAIQDIIDNSGKGVMMILEGYDELPDELVNDSDRVFDQIMQSLPLATIIVTSRPSVKRQLIQSVGFTHHIEVLGFTKDNITKYIHNFFESKKSLHMHDEFLQYIEHFPKIEKCLYVPINLEIVLEVFQHSLVGSRETMTELYDTLVRMLIYRHLKSLHPSMNINFSSLKELPEPTLSEFHNLCKLAYNGIFKKQQLVFYCHESFETLGLMQKESQMLPSKGGDVFVYSFLHLTIQEFLAAYHVHLMPIKEIQKHFDESIDILALHIMRRFLAGLTKLQSVSVNVVEEIEDPNIFYEFFEAQNDALASEVFGEKTKVTTKNRCSPVLITQDVYVLGRCIALGKCSWWLGFTLRGITSEHLNMFIAGLNFKRAIKGQIEHIGLSLNPLGNEGMKSLLKFPSLVLQNLRSLYLRGIEVDAHCLNDLVSKVPNLKNLELLLFHDNYLEEDEQEHFIKALCNSKSLKHVSLSTLSPDECMTLITSSHTLHTIELYQLSPLSVGAVLGHLSKGTNLKHLQIHQSEVKTEFVRSLQINLPLSHLKSLEFINCAIDSKTVRIIAVAVMNTPLLEKLNVSDNLIDDEGGCLLSDKISSILSMKSSKQPTMKPQLKEVCLDHNLFTEKTISKLINELSSCQPRSYITIHLSLKWQEYVQKHPKYQKVQVYFQFGRIEDNH